jgi:hypothetical protein
VQSLDRLDIETPEQIALELPLAGIGSRFLALAIDSLLQGVCILAIVISWCPSAFTGDILHFLKSGGREPLRVNGLREFE